MNTSTYHVEMVLRRAMQVYLSRLFRRGVGHTMHMCDDYFALAGMTLFVVCRFFCYLTWCWCMSCVLIQMYSLSFWRTHSKNNKSELPPIIPNSSCPPPPRHPANCTLEFPNFPRLDFRNWISKLISKLRGLIS